MRYLGTIQLNTRSWFINYQVPPDLIVIPYCEICQYIYRQSWYRSDQLTYCECQAGSESGEGWGTDRICNYLCSSYFFQSVLPISHMSAWVLTMWGAWLPTAESQINLIWLWMSSHTKPLQFFLVRFSWSPLFLREQRLQALMSSITWQHHFN